MARIVALLFALLWAANSRAGAPWDDPKTPEGWAWTQIRGDRTADFDAKCGKTLDPRQAEGWDDPCRQVSAQFLVALLTGPKYRDRIPQHGLHLVGAAVAGAIDLSELDMTPEVRLEGSRFAGGLTLADSHWRQLLSLRGSAIEGDFHAERLHADSSILIDGEAGMAHASVAGNVDLTGARVGGDLDMQSSRFGSLVAWGAKIDGNLQMREAAFAGGVELAGAKIAGNLSMVEAWFAGGVELAGAGIDGSVFMSGATFGDTLSLRYAKIGGVLDLTYATAVSVDLSEADATELLVNGLHWRCAAMGTAVGGAGPRPRATAPPPPVDWPLGNEAGGGPASCGGSSTNVPKMVLRNAHFADFQDSADAWPPALDLVGFRYDRLGGLGGDGRLAMQSRAPRKWIDWLDRDRDYSSQPYSELATVLAAAGDRDTADDVQFAGHERERREVCGRDPLSPRCLWLSFLSFTAGYGVERYMWRVVPWVIGFTLVGTAVLAFSANARRHGGVWMIGASLHRLLPVVSLYKEFDDFFDNPPVEGASRRNLRPWQVFYFACHAIVGWGLGLILLAAMSGITQRS